MLAAVTDWKSPPLTMLSFPNLPVVPLKITKLLSVAADGPTKSPKLAPVTGATKGLTKSSKPVIGFNLKGIYFLSKNRSHGQPNFHRQSGFLLHLHHYKLILIFSNLD